MSEEQVSPQSQKGQHPAAERPSAHFGNCTALTAISLVELILPWSHPMYHPSSSALLPHFLCYSVKKSYNCTAVIWWRDGWEQQNRIRSSRHSSDCLLQMEMRSPCFFLRCMATSREGLLQADFFCGGTQRYCKAGRTAAHQEMEDIMKSAQSRLPTCLPRASHSFLHSSISNWRSLLNKQQATFYLPCTSVAWEHCILPLNPIHSKQCFFYQFFPLLPGLFPSKTVPLLLVAMSFCFVNIVF